MFSRFHILFLSLLLLIGGCTRGPNPQDPYESFNRNVFAMNQKIDRHIIRPSAVLYTKILPWPVRTGISNAFSNLGELTNIANNSLQGKVHGALTSTWRFIINSTVGIAGLIDVAKHIGLAPQYQDFGLTMAFYGDEHSPYFERPIAGPSTFRDFFGSIVDNLLWGQVTYIPHTGAQYALAGVYAIDYRASILPSEKMMNAASIDPYAFRRNAYLQYRAARIKSNRAIVPLKHHEDDPDPLPLDDEED